MPRRKLASALLAAAAVAWASGLRADEGAPAEEPAAALRPEPPQASAAQPAQPGDRELQALLLAEAVARPAIDAAKEQARQAYHLWRQAAQLLATSRAPQEARRPTEEQVEKLLADFHAKRDAMNRLFGEHVGRYAELLASHPCNWRIHHRLAWFYADYNDLLNAAEYWRRTIALRPDFAFAYNNLGTVYNHLGRDMESVDLYLKAISLKADEAEFHFNLANMLSLHRFEVRDKFGWPLPRVFSESIKHYRVARDLEPANYEYAEAVATQYVLAKHFGVSDWADEAIKDWQFCLKLRQDVNQRRRVLTNLARIHLREKKDPAKARALLLEAYKLGDDPTVRELLKQAQGPLNAL